MKHHKVDSTTLARQFCEVIKSWLTDEQLNEVNRLNKTEDYYMPAHCTTSAMPTKP